MLNDIKANLSFCLHCHHLSPHTLENCPFCYEEVHQRKQNSIARTWALSIAALLFYIPANIYPIMKVVSVRTYENNTIIDGIFYFYKHNEFFVGTVIFIASIFVPIYKLVVLFFLLYSVRSGSRWRLAEKSRLYKMIHRIGKWSMLDIFVIGLMISLVQFGQFAVITTGAAASSFAFMVILTIFATESFDIRLLWDEKDKNG